jgi:hypothetical protein
MKAKKFVIVFMFVLMGLVAGCHYGDDRWSGYGARGSYRDGFQDGRSYERRRGAWGYSPYYERYGYYRR